MFDFTKDAKLPPALAARMQATVERREAQGLNVHFINEFGQHDRYSLANAKRADAFRAGLRRDGLSEVA